MKPRHTEIVETLETAAGTVVREDPYLFPPGQSNLYMLEPSGNVAWFAELPLPNDSYPNRVRLTDGGTFRSTSWAGIDCEIDLQTGKILATVLKK